MTIILNLSLSHNVFPIELEKLAAAEASTRTTTRAVIHMGPHKTGTTSIQTAAGEHLKQLHQDGFDAVCAFEKKRNKCTRHFSSCFLPPESAEAMTYKCNDKYLLDGSTIARNKRNLFVSAEDFSAIGLSGSDGVEKLHGYLSQWDDVTIVVYYRHFFSYLGSKYNQRMKNKSIKRGWYKTIQDFVDQNNDSRYTLQLVKRLERKFDNIVVVNMHEMSPVESFFCHTHLSFFKNMCEAVCSEEELQMNSSEKLHHIHLLASAVEAGLLSKEKASKLSVQQSVQSKVREIESSTGVEMKLKCLSPQTLHEIWRKSLIYKRTLFPTTSGVANLTSSSEKYGDELTKDEKHMKSEFELAAKSSLCMVDVDEALSQADWKIFFKSI